MRRPSAMRTRWRRTIPTSGPSATNGRDTAICARAPVRRHASSWAAVAKSPTTIEGFADDQPGNRQLLIDANRIRGANLGLCRRDALGQTAQNSWLAGGGRDQMEGMHRPPLSDAIHTADALFEAHRIP